MKEKLFDVWGACREVAGSDRRIRYKDGSWHSLVFGRDEIYLSREKNHKMFPRPKMSKEKAWQVEPEPEEPKDIIVWAINDRGESYLFQKRPLYSNNYGWHEPHHTCGFRLPVNCDFPKDKPQKFKLEPVEEQNA